MRRLLLCCLLTLAAAIAQETPAAIYSKVKKSVVLIKGAHKQGSGLVIGATRCPVVAVNCVPHSGYVLTNFHVLAGETAVTLIFDDGREVKIDSVMADDPDLDLALISLPDLPGEGLYAADLDFTGDLVVGEKVFAVGNPLGLEGSLSDGLVSGFRQYSGHQMIQFSAPVSPGSSGGPLVNEHGSVIGIVTESVEGGQNLNLALPTSALRELARKTLTENPTGPLPRIDLASLAPQTDETVLAVLRRVQTYIDNEMNDEAERALRVAIEQDEFNSVLRLELARLLVRTGRFDLAQAELRTVLRLDPKALLAWALTADLDLKRWLTTASASDWIDAFRIYSDLVGNGESDALLKARASGALNRAGPVSDLAEIRIRGHITGNPLEPAQTASMLDAFVKETRDGWRAVLKDMESPAGNWSDGWLHGTDRKFSVVESPPGTQATIKLVPDLSFMPSSLSRNAAEGLWAQTALRLPTEDIDLQSSGGPNLYTASSSDFHDLWCGYKESLQVEIAPDGSSLKITGLITEVTSIQRDAIGIYGRTKAMQLCLKPGDRGINTSLTRIPSPIDSIILDARIASDAVPLLSRY